VWENHQVREEVNYSSPPASLEVPSPPPLPAADGRAALGPDVIAYAVPALTAKLAPSQYHPTCSRPHLDKLPHN